MANCHKCGKLKIRKRRDGTRCCKRCGTLPGLYRLSRSGFDPATIAYLESLDSDYQFSPTGGANATF